MKLNQLSVFLENRPGHLHEACRLLAEAGLSILTLSLADTRQFGILHLIVSDWQKARDLLEKSGFVVKVTDVLALEVDDRPGGLAEVLSAVQAAGLNVEYMYAFAFGRRRKAVMIFRFDDPDKAAAKLQARGVNLVQNLELLSRAEE